MKFGNALAAGKQHSSSQDVELEVARGSQPRPPALELPSRSWPGATRDTAFGFQGLGTPRKWVVFQGVCVTAENTLVNRRAAGLILPLAAFSRGWQDC